jgi:hypothetical protein
MGGHIEYLALGNQCEGDGGNKNYLFGVSECTEFPPLACRPVVLAARYLVQLGVKHPLQHVVGAGTCISLRARAVRPALAARTLYRAVADDKGTPPTVALIMPAHALTLVVVRSLVLAFIHLIGTNKKVMIAFVSIDVCCLGGHC